MDSVKPIKSLAAVTETALAKRPSAIEKLGAKAESTMASKAGDVIDAEFSVLPDTMKLGTGKAGPLALPAQAESPKLSADKLFKDLYVTKEQKIAGRMGTETKKTEALNPQFKAAVESGDAVLPPGVRIEGDQIVEKVVSKGGVSEAPVSAAKSTSILKRTIVGGGLAASAATAAVVANKPESLDDMKPPPEAKTLDEQLQGKAAEAAAAKTRERGGPTSAGVAGESKIRTAMGVTATPLMPQIISLTERAQTLEQGLSSEQRDFYNEKLAAVRTQTQTLMDKFDEQKAQAKDENTMTDVYLALGQGMEMIGQNLVRLYAANYGLKKGVDLSGLKFDKFDWTSTQARYDKRFENLIKSIDDKQEQALTSEASKSEKIIGEAGAAERATLKEAGDLRSKAADLAVRDAENKQQATKDNAEFQQRGEIAQERLALDAERLDVMRERNADMKEAKVQGKVDKAKQIEDKLKLEAVRKLKAGIAAEVGTGETLSDKQMQKVIKQASEELSKADIDLNEILPGVTSSSWWGMGSDKVDRAGLLEKLDAFAGPNKQVAPSQGVMYSESADDIPDLLE